LKLPRTDSQLHSGILPWDFRKSIDRKKAAVNEAKTKKPESKKTGT